LVISIRTGVASYKDTEFVQPASESVFKKRNFVPVEGIEQLWNSILGEFSNQWNLSLTTLHHITTT